MIFTNYFIPLWYIPSQERGALRPTSFLLQPLPYKYYSYLSTIPSVYSETKNGLSINIDHLAIQYSVLSVNNLIGYNPDEPLVDLLPEEIYTDLLQAIKKHFFLSEEDKQKINDLAEYLLTERFQDESWSCEVCRERGLDKQRNCPLLSKEEQKKHFNESFFVPFNGRKVTQCPVGTVSLPDASAISEAGAFFRKGIFPEKGGMGDQTLFFGYAGQVMDNKVELKKQKMYEERTSK